MNLAFPRNQASGAPRLTGVSTLLRGLCTFGVLIALCLGQGVYPISRGILKSISQGQLSVAVDDEHEMKFRITRKTRFFASRRDQGKQRTEDVKVSSLQPGQTVAVEAQSSIDGSFEAVRVTIELPK